MAAATTTKKVFESCIPVHRTNIDSTGAVTLTEAIAPYPSEMEAFYTEATLPGQAGVVNPGHWRIMEALLDWQLEANMLSIEQDGMFELFAACAVNVSERLSVPEKLNSGLLRVAPFVTAHREEPVNNNYWKISAGQRADANGDANAAGAYWKCTVTSPTNIPAAAGWFGANSNVTGTSTVGNRVFCTTVADGGTVSETVWLVASATVSGNDVILVLYPAMAGSNRAGAGFDWGATNVALTPPVTGLLRTGTRNVSPYEPYCEQPPGIITGQFDPYWVESNQTSFMVDEGYEEWQNLIFDNNPLYARLFDLPLVQYNKQVGTKFKKDWTHTAMFGCARDANQTLEGYRALSTCSFGFPWGGSAAGTNVTDWAGYGSDPRGATEVISYRADNVGFYEQHAKWNRIQDCLNSNLNLPALFKELFNMWRYRKAIGLPNPEIFECMMPMQFYPKFFSGMMEYYKNIGKGMMQLYQDINKQKTAVPRWFAYTDFPLMYPAGCTIRVVFQRYFDDMLLAAQDAGIEAAGRQLWFMSWKHNRVGIVNTERDVRDIGDIKALAAVNPNFACVMRGRKRKVELTNMTYCSMSTACPADLIVQGFSDSDPEALNQGQEDYSGTCTSTPTTN